MTSSGSDTSLILVVEDQDDLRAAALELLNEAGFQTLEAPDASAALAVMEKHWQNVRILFTDVRMPGEIDGIDLVEEVHRCWPKVLLLVTSAGLDVKEDALPDDGRFLPKPYRASTLLAQVRTLIAEHQSNSPRA